MPHLSPTGHEVYSCRTCIAIGFMWVAQSQGAAQRGPEIRLIDAPVASVRGQFGYIDRVRELPDGRVLINDASDRRVIAFDPALSSSVLVVDSTHAGHRTYGIGPSMLVPFVGDSTLLIDPATQSMLVIDPHGRVARTAAAPVGAALFALSSQSVGFDGRGRLIFVGSYPRDLRRSVSALGAASGPPARPDSAPLLAYDLHTRRLDTLGSLRIPRTLRIVIRQDSVTMTRNTSEPLPVVDEAVVLSDGRIAVVRGRDYRIDWVTAGRGIVRGPRIDFPWQRITDSVKSAMIDSIAGPFRGQRHGGALADTARSPLEGLTADDIPDYWPAFTPGSVRADGDGNLWVRTTTRHGVALGSVYDVINGSGTLVRRVQLLAGHGIIGFGRHGTVFMASRDGDQTKIEKAYLPSK